MTGRRLDPDEVEVRIVGDPAAVDQMLATLRTIDPDLTIRGPVPRRTGRAVSAYARLRHPWPGQRPHSERLGRCPAVPPSNWQTTICHTIAVDGGHIPADADWRCWLAPHDDDNHYARPLTKGHFYRFMMHRATAAGDPVSQSLAKEITSPEQMLGGRDESGPQ